MFVILYVVTFPFSVVDLSRIIEIKCSMRECLELINNKWKFLPCSLVDTKIQWIIDALKKLIVSCNPRYYLEKNL